MQNFPKISIIIPVYNVEKYIKRCLESILAQTFKDYEVILVDDGSTDKSSEICNEYALKDSRIKVIHQKNSGASAARNAGLKIAGGEYIGFIDSDDYIAKDMYETLYKLITKYNTDIAICGLLHEYKNYTVDPYPHEEESKISGLEALKIALIGKKFSVNVYNKIYKKDLFKDIQFPKLKFAEDGYVLTRILYKAKSVAYNTSPKYFWQHHKGSVTNSSFDKREWETVKVYTENLNFIKENCPSLILEATCRYYLAYFWLIDKIALSKGPLPKYDLKKAIKVLRKDYFKIISNPYFSFKRKISITVLLFSWNIYREIVKKFSK